MIASHPHRYGPAITLASAGGLVQVAYFPRARVFAGTDEAGWRYAHMPFNEATQIVGEIVMAGITFRPVEVVNWIDSVTTLLQDEGQ